VQSLAQRATIRDDGIGGKQRHKTQEGTAVENLQFSFSI
jgi:hypothetical protein